jgi:ketosteroid isomerase-like protein
MPHTRTVFVIAVAASLLPFALNAAPLDDVMQTDRAFAAAAVKDGARAAFVAFAAPDAIMFSQGVGPVKGHAAISAQFGTGEGPLPEWAPEGGEVAGSGDLAYTWGYYKWTARDGSGKHATGNYVSIWRRVDGQWKWIVDLGVAAPPKAN